MQETPVPRPEYPRPQFERSGWLNLNGYWRFAEDPGDSGCDRDWQDPGAAETVFNQRIQVPFCRESRLSGLEHNDRCIAVWYARDLGIPRDWAGQRILLHFGAADYETHVWIDGREVGLHRGGHSSFTFEITEFSKPGESQLLTVRCRDDWWSVQPRGKQATQVKNQAVHYTRSTGIWQTVWLEMVPPSYLERARITPNVDNGTFLIDQPINGWCRGQTVRAELRLDPESDPIATARTVVQSDFTPQLLLRIPEEHRRLWSCNDPFLYDLTLMLHEGGSSQPLDRVKSYAGLRSVAVEGKKVLINGKSVFQRLVLDQGYYPDGLLTAPSDAALIRDIKLGKEAGFNGARLHQKIFEERFLYHADRLGYLTWGELPDWCNNFYDTFIMHQDRWNAGWISEWLEAVRRDYSHPCIIGWCPMNEQMHQYPEQGKMLHFIMHALFWATKSADPTRPVLDASGWPHLVAETDVYDHHDYEQEAGKLIAKYRADENGVIDLEPGVAAEKRNHVRHRGQPFWLSEIGGMRWTPEMAEAARRLEDDPDAGWGYGRAPRSLDEFYERFEALCTALLGDSNMFGYCYTQITDVFQEQNGIYGFDRSHKFDTGRLAAIQQQPAAIEKE